MTARKNLETGRALRETRLARKMTVAKLSRLSGVSRRHIAVAEDGGNISLEILRRLMETLQLDTVPLGPLGVTAMVSAVDAALVLDALAEIDRAMGELRDRVALLRGVVERAPRAAKG